MHLKEAQGLLGIYANVPCILTHNTNAGEITMGMFIFIYIYIYIHIRNGWGKKSIEFIKSRSEKSHTC